MSWIKFRTNLIDDGRVTLALRRCSVSRSAIVGALVTLWALADSQADDDGVLFGWSAEDIDRKVEIENFCRSLPPCWIDLSGEFVKLPCYQEHNGSTAKVRAQAQKRNKTLRSRDAVSVSASNSNSNNKKKEKGVPVEVRSEALSVWPGCSQFRLSEREYQLALANYSKNRWPGNWLDHAITEVDLWLCGETTAAIKARRSKTHLKQLYATWVLEKAQKRASLAATSAGRQSVPMHPSHKPFIKEAPKTSAELELEKRAALKTVEQFAIKIQEI